MPANTTPIYSVAPDVQWNTTNIATANTTTDLTTGTSYLVFTADATNGGYVQKLIFRALGTNTASVARIWVNNGATTGTAANNTCVAEATLASTTVSQTAATAQVEVALNFALPAGYTLYVTIGTSVAAGYNCAVIGGKY